MSTTAARRTALAPMIRYDDFHTHEWMRTKAPCRWHGKVELRFEPVPFSSLEHAGSYVRPDVYERWVARLRMGRKIPPPIACETERGSLYLHDGNHRHRALQEFLGERTSTLVRTALLVPREGYQFRYRWFGWYGTYVLERRSQCEVILPSRTLPLTVAVRGPNSFGELARPMNTWRIPIGT
ncbi:MAG TPA: hypothetical protein VN622_01390 [Clostridia bacterium]|nr:hypothetical protein [Clostridia bacterium]